MLIASILVKITNCVMSSASFMLCSAPLLLTRSPAVTPYYSAGHEEVVGNHFYGNVKAVPCLGIDNNITASSFTKV